MKIPLPGARWNGRGVRLLRLVCIVALLSVIVDRIKSLEVFRYTGTSVGAASLPLPSYDSTPQNTWVQLDTFASELPDFRTDHGGAVYDPDRNSVFLFGSDTHLHSFDSNIYELSLDDLRWRKRYDGAPSYTMRTNVQGVRIAGAEGREPWPMHVYDSMVYDPVARQIIVTSGAKHNFFPRPGRQLDALWAYLPDENRWKILNTPGPPAPVFFSAGSVYDPARNAVIGYGALADSRPFLPLAGEKEVERSGVWELGPERSGWIRVSDEVHHNGWFNLEFDRANRVMLVFGGHEGDPSIWTYEVGPTVGATGRWLRRQPVGDTCPGGNYFPAAYDTRRHVTFYMPIDLGTGRRITCVYDYAKNSVQRLEGAELQDAGLNYTMVYAEKEDVFLLLTGSFSRGVRTKVWILRPDLSGLEW